LVINALVGAIVLTKAFSGLGFLAEFVPISGTFTHRCEWNHQSFVFWKISLENKEQVYKTVGD
jgi:hypothetical protein